MATWSSPFMRRLLRRGAAGAAAEREGGAYLLPLLHLHPDHLQRPEQPHRVHLRSLAEGDMRRVRDRLPEGRVDRDPLSAAADLRPRVPVERVLPVLVARVD